MSAGDRSVSQGGGWKVQLPVATGFCCSREGSNPYGACSQYERLDLKASFPAYAQWMAVPRNFGLRPSFPAFAGITIAISRLALSKDMPVKAISMRISRHVLTRSKLEGLAQGHAFPGNANKMWIKRSGLGSASAGLASG